MNETPLTLTAAPDPLTGYVHVTTNPAAAPVAPVHPVHAVHAAVLAAIGVAVLAVCTRVVLVAGQHPDAATVAAVCTLGAAALVTLTAAALLLTRGR